MDCNRFHTGIAMRAATLFFTFALAAWMIAHTQWYVSIALVVVGALVQIALFMRYTTLSDREVARFLDAVSLDDTTQSFSSLISDTAHRELGIAMARVLERLHASRQQREEQACYLQALLAHVPVALIAIESNGDVQVLNLAARRLFESCITTTSGFTHHGAAFATGIEALEPGSSTIVRMERPSGALQLKASATDLTIRGRKQRIVSLQNIENELSAHELAAWQTVIRTMAHEMMNSLTPISSLATTAHGLVRQALDAFPPESRQVLALHDAIEALETVARRSEGLLHFVQNHRRLTKRLVTRTEVVPVHRLFARASRLFADELAMHEIALETAVEPETLEVEADIELMDQALINLLRNAVEAIGNEKTKIIRLRAYRNADGSPVIVVADTGPGISPEQRDKVFVPFFTTKRQGSGVGLTLVRQIAVVHNAKVDITETPGGGATVCIRF